MSYFLNQFRWLQTTVRKGKIQLSILPASSVIRFYWWWAFQKSYCLNREKTTADGERQAHKNAVIMEIFIVLILAVYLGITVHDVEEFTHSSFTYSLLKCLTFQIYAYTQTLITLRWDGHQCCGIILRAFMSDWLSKYWLLFPSKIYISAIHSSFLLLLIFFIFHHGYHSL